MADASSNRFDKDYEVLQRRNIALRRQVDHLSMLREIGLAVNASLELSETLPVIAEVVQGALQIPRLTIYVLEKDRKTLRPIVAKYGDDLIDEERLAEDSIQAAGTPYGEAISTKHVVLNETSYGYQAYVPLNVKADALGVMVLQNTGDGAAFDKDDADLFYQLGLQIAIAINNARLYALAVKDGLTGLYVRRYFDLRLDDEFEQAVRYGRVFSLLLFDIDHFKVFNDTHGHQTGDMVLQQFARLLEANTRKADVCCRYGGEEMAVILPETELDAAVVLANKLCRLIRAYEFTGLEEQSLSVTTSIGVVQYDPQLADPAAMIKAVDTALYEAKELGRNRVEIAGI